MVEEAEPVLRDVRLVGALERQTARSRPVPRAGQDRVAPPWGPLLRFWRCPGAGSWGLFLWSIPGGGRSSARPLARAFFWTVLRPHCGSGCRC